VSTEPVTLDFSKAQPVSQPTQPGGVTLDFSKAQPLQPPQSGGAGMNAALDNPAIKDLEQGNREASTTAGELEGAKGLVQGGVGLAKAGVKALTEPTIGAAKSVGTGLVDAAGNEIKREVATEGPSLLKQGVDKVTEAVKDVLPKGATPEQAIKVARLVYHLGLGAGSATFIWHELFGGK